jgi:hypothetical protein
VNLEILSRSFAPVRDFLVFDDLPLIEAAEAGSFDGRDVDKQISAALILTRTAEGRVRAKARGVKFGRKSVLTPHQRSDALARRVVGEALVEIARTYNVFHSTIGRLAE